MINLQDRRRVHDKCDCFLDTDRWRVGPQLTLWTMHCAVLINNAAVAAVLSVHLSAKSEVADRLFSRRCGVNGSSPRTVSKNIRSSCTPRPGRLLWHGRPRSWSCTRPSAYKTTKLHHVASQRHGRRWGCTQDTMSDRWLYVTDGVCAIKQKASPGRAGCEPTQAANGERSDTVHKERRQERSKQLNNWRWGAFQTRIVRMPSPAMSSGSTSSSCGVMSDSSGGSHESSPREGDGRMA